MEVVHSTAISRSWSRIPGGSMTVKRLQFSENAQVVLRLGCLACPRITWRVGRVYFWCATVCCRTTLIELFRKERHCEQRDGRVSGITSVTTVCHGPLGFLRVKSSQNLRPLIIALFFLSFWRPPNQQERGGRNKL